MASKDFRPTSNGGSWRVRWYENGRLESTTVHTETDADELIGRIETNGGKGLDVLRQADLARLMPQPEPVATPHDRSHQTIAELCREWIDVRSRGNEQSKKVLRMNLENHIVPYIGDVPVAEAKPRQFLMWQQRLLTSPPEKGKRRQLSEKSIKNYRGDILVPAMDYACGMSMDGEPAIRYDNPIKLVPPVRVAKVEKTRLRSAREVSLFCQAAYEISQPWGDRVSVGLAGAFRPGEVVRLKPRAANRDQQSLFVWEVRRVDIENDVTIARDAKSIAGYGREVPIATPVWKAIVLPSIERGRTARDALIVCGPNGEMWNKSTERNLWARTIDIVADKGLFKDGMKLSNLRHSMAQWWNRHGFGAIPQKKVMGHKIHDTTTDYNGNELFEIERLQCLAASDLLFSEWTRG